MKLFGDSVGRYYGNSGFSLFLIIGTGVLGRERSEVRSDGTTSLTLDVFQLCF